MLTMNSHGVAISIARCVREMVSAPNLMRPWCPYIRVLPSTLTLRDSYPRVEQLMTHSELLCEINQVTRPRQLRHIS